MLDADDLRFFAAVSCAPSLAAAARALNITPPAVTQRLQALEQRLGVRLVDRSGRHVALTDEGELLSRRGRELLKAFEALSEALVKRKEQVSGNLRIVGPLGFGRRYLAPIAASFRTDHPQVRIDLRLSDRIGRLAEGTWDLAIHIGDGQEVAPSLTSCTLAPNRRLLCASPAYVARSGNPARPEDLQAHTCIALRENDEDVAVWRFRHANGNESRIRIAPELASNDGEVAKRWALAGLGLIVRSEWDVADDLRAGRLVTVLNGFALPDAPVVALLASDQRSRAARTGRFLQTLQRLLNPPPWREPTA